MQMSLDFGFDPSHVLVFEGPPVTQEGVAKVKYLHTYLAWLAPENLATPAVDVNF
jgi:hypothetical protein